MTPHLHIEDLRGPIVGPVSFGLCRGGCIAIAGPSGAGKSVLLRMIADLDPNEGKVRLGARDRSTFAVPDWRRQVMYLAAEPGWWKTTMEDHIPAQDRDVAFSMASRLGLAADDLRRPLTTLSTGEKQRLALVRALVRRPAVLLLDEPTSALDPPRIDAVETLLSETRAGGTSLVLVTHDAEQARRLGADRYHMDAGLLGPA